MNTEEKEQYYRSEYLGAPLSSDHTDHMNFRCQKSLATWIRITAATENRDVSMVIRRLLHWAAEQEGFDINGI